MALARLEEIDRAALQFDKERSTLPQELAEMQADLGKLESLLERERVQLQEAEALRKTQQEDLESRSEALSKAKAKVAKGRNIKEIDAAEREVEANRQAIRNREEELQRLDSALEKVMGSLAQHEKEVDEVRKELELERTSVTARLQKLEEIREKTLEKRGFATAHLDATILRRYERIRDAKGQGVAIIESETCPACRISIAAQQYIDLQRGEELHQCPRCQVFLVHRGFAYPD